MSWKDVAVNVLTMLVEPLVRPHGWQISRLCRKCFNAQTDKAVYYAFEAPGDCVRCEQNTQPRDSVAIEGGVFETGKLPQRCRLQVREFDGTETRCLWAQGHKGRCTFEAVCPGNGQVKLCKKHWAHPGLCVEGSEAV
jgi:hypothetical protein